MNGKAIFVSYDMMPKAIGPLILAKIIFLYYEHIFLAKTIQIPVKYYVP